MSNELFGIGEALEAELITHNSSLITHHFLLNVDRAVADSQLK